MSTKVCKACVTCRTSSAQMCFFTPMINDDSLPLFLLIQTERLYSLYKPLWQSSLHQRQSQFVRCQSVSTNRPKCKFQAADKENDKNPTCKPLKMQFIINRDPHSHKWNEWKCTGRFLSAKRYQTLRYRKGKEKHNRKKQKKQMKK